MGQPDEALEEERRLVERARQEPEAFGLLYDRYVEPLYRAAYRRTASHEAAEDLTARTFHRALVALPRYQWQGVPFGAWLARIARNLHTDDLRRGGPGHSLDRLQAEGFEPAAGDCPPDSDLLRREEGDALWTAVATLPLMQQRAVVLHFARGLPYAEVGRRIGRSEAASKQLVYRAVQTLRARFPREEANDGRAQGREYSGDE